MDKSNVILTIIISPILILGGINMKLKFKEIEQPKLNCGWCMGAGVVAGVVGTGAVAGAIVVLT